MQQRSRTPLRPRDRSTAPLHQPRPAHRTELSPGAAGEPRRPPKRGQRRPPIDAADIHPSATREPSILTVGRFFAPGLGHAKRQLEMVRFFGQIVRAGGLPGWTLHVVGGCEESQRPYLERVRQAAAGLPVEIHANAPRSLVHRLMESFDFCSPRAPSPERVSDSARELGIDVGRGERAEIAGLIAGAMGSRLIERLARARSLRREHPFAFSLGSEQPLVTGVIDLLAHEADGSFLVVDYKSDRVGQELELSALVDSDYGVQRLLYGLAVLRAGAPSVEVVHWFLERPHEWVAIRYTAPERPALEQGLTARIARSGEAGFRVSATPHRGLCETCPGRAGLCSWGDAETLRELPPRSAAAEA